MLLNRMLCEVSLAQVYPLEIGQGMVSYREELKHILISANKMTTEGNTKYKAALV